MCKIVHDHWSIPLFLRGTILHKELDWSIAAYAVAIHSHKRPGAVFIWWDVERIGPTRCSRLSSPWLWLRRRNIWEELRREELFYKKKVAILSKGELRFWASILTHRGIAYRSIDRIVLSSTSPIIKIAVLLLKMSWFVRKIVSKGLAKSGSAYKA